MNQNIILTIVEFVASVVVEGIILAMIFQWVANRGQEKQKQHLAEQMHTVEKQNTFIYEQLIEEIRVTKTDLLNQIKEQKEKEG